MEVRDDRDEHRFTLEAEGETALLEYRTRADRLVLVHTEVPDALGGRGIGAMLVKAALERARGEGLTVVPLCPYARRWMTDHPDALDGITVDWTHEPSDD